MITFGASSWKRCRLKTSGRKSTSYDELMLHSRITSRELTVCRWWWRSVWQERSRWWWWRPGPRAPPLCSPQSAQLSSRWSPPQGFGSPGFVRREGKTAGTLCLCPRVCHPGTCEGERNATESLWLVFKNNFYQRLLWGHFGFFFGEHAARKDWRHSHCARTLNGHNPRRKHRLNWRINNNNNDGLDSFSAF